VQCTQKAPFTELDQICDFFRPPDLDPVAVSERYTLSAVKYSIRLQLFIS
jgi:hypothetical protein